MIILKTREIILYFLMISSFLLSTTVYGKRLETPVLNYPVYECTFENKVIRIEANSEQFIDTEKLYVYKKEKSITYVNKKDQTALLIKFDSLGNKTITLHTRECRRIYD